MKKGILGKIFWLCILGYIISIFMLISSFATFQYAEEMHLFQEPFPVSIADKIYASDNRYLFTHNKDFGIVQCFDFQGNFKFGVHLKKTKNIDSTALSLKDNTLFLLEQVTDTVYTIQNGVLSKTEKKEDSNYDVEDFLSEYPREINSSVHSIGKTVYVSFNNSDQKETIHLKVDYFYSSPFYSLIGIGISSLGVILVKKKLD